MQDLSRLTLSELEDKRALCKCFVDLASVGVDTEDLHNNWTEYLRRIDAEILERSLLKDES